MTSKGGQSHGETAIAWRRRFPRAPGDEDCREVATQVEPPARDDGPRTREQEPAGKSGDSTADVCLLIDVGYEAQPRMAMMTMTLIKLPRNDLSIDVRNCPAMHEQEGGECPEQSANRAGSPDADPHGIGCETCKRPPTPDAR